MQKQYFEKRIKKALLGGLFKNLDYKLGVLNYAEEYFFSNFRSGWFGATHQKHSIFSYLKKANSPRQGHIPHRC